MLFSPLGNSLILGVNSEGLLLIKRDDKLVLYEYRYQDIESIFLDPSDSLLTVNLMRHLPDNSHKCFVLETAHKAEIGSLIVSYCPALANWIIENEAAVRKVSICQQPNPFVFVTHRANRGLFGPSRNTRFL